MGVDLDPSRLVAELPPATRTVLAIAAALARSARILVLDEPTASLGASDVQALFRVLRRISGAGNAVIFVSHRLDEVYELCDRITVLRDGATVGTVMPDDITKDDLIALICGHRVVIDKKTEAAATTKPALTAKNLRGTIVGPVSFTIQTGEIVGLTGLSDAGHYEVGEILFGLKRPRSGLAHSVRPALCAWFASRGHAAWNWLRAAGSKPVGLGARYEPLGKPIL